MNFAHIVLIVDSD